MVEKPKKARQASREGRANVSWWTTPERRKLLNLLSAETGYDQQELLDRALDLLLKQKIKPKPEA